jgi:hypothetical protein
MLQYNANWAWKISQVSHFPSTTSSSLAFQSIQSKRQLQREQRQRLILDLRGGSDENTDDEIDTLDHGSSSQEDDSEVDKDNDISESSLEETQQNDNEEVGEEENDDAKAPTSSSPVKITLKTAVTNNPLIEQSIEITASPTRTVYSLKQSVSRQFKSKPPIESIQLRLDGKLLDDNEILVEDLVVEEDDEEEEEEDDHDGMPKLNIIVDMIPPVDPKFGTEIKERLDHITNEQLLEAYIVNLAAMHQNSMDVMTQSMESYPSETETHEEEDDGEVMDETLTSEPILPINLGLQKYATMIKSQIMNSLSEDEKKMLEKTDTPSSAMQEDSDSYNTGDLLLKESIKRKKRRGGATVNMKRVIQKNLNIVSCF